MPIANRMPYVLEAEQAVLGCILIDQVVQGEILSALKDYDFLMESHKKILQAMRELNNDNVVVDTVTLSAHMQKDGSLEQVGGMAYLTELTMVVPSSANYARYLEIVKRDGILRRLINGSNEIIRDAASSQDSRKSLSYAEQIIFDISEENDRHGLERIGEYFDPVINKFSRLESDKDFLLGLKTGFTQLDNMTNGLHNGNLIIIAARPSIGKTTFAMNIVEHMAASGKVCAVFALEMTREELAQRMLCSVGNVKMDDALKGRLTQTDPTSYNRLWEAKKMFGNAGIFIDESTEVTPQDILSKCRRLKMRHGLDVIVVDHMQLMQAPRQNIESRQQEITEISRGLKNIAKELNVPVIALSQLSRQSTKRSGNIPILSDLRESGAIEQDADLVVLLHRPDKNNVDAKETTIVDPNETLVIVAKNRNGVTGEFKLRFKGEFVKFVNAAPDAFNNMDKKSADAQRGNNSRDEKKTSAVDGGNSDYGGHDYSGGAVDGAGAGDFGVTNMPDMPNIPNMPDMPDMPDSGEDDDPIF